MAIHPDGLRRDVEVRPMGSANAERERARKERQLAARLLHEAFLYGGPLEAQRRQKAELHLTAAQHHERIALEIDEHRGSSAG